MTKILLAEDDINIIELIKDVLTSEGYEICIAENGIKALDLLNKEYPDLVITDITMPEMNGFTLCQEIRKNSTFKDLPILILTGKDLIEDKYLGFTKGADDYLTKPFNIIELSLRVKALLRRQRKYQNVDSVKNEFILNDKNSSLKLQNGKEVFLTEIEFKIFSYLLQHRGEIITSKILHTKALDIPIYVGDEGHIRNHIRNIRIKIEKDPSRPLIIKTIPHRGYIIE